MHQLLNSGFTCALGEVSSLELCHTRPVWHLGSSSISVFPRVAISILSETSRAPARSPCAEIPVQGSSWVALLSVPVELEPH